MVSVSCDSHRNECQVIAEPDRSLNHRQTLLFFASVSFVVVAVAIGFTFLGAWLVLPFAGLELLALGAALYFSRANARMRETICVDPVRVHIYRQRANQPSACFGGGEGAGSFPTAWLRVRRSARRGWYPKRLFVGASGKWVELGNFLTEEQRDRLGSGIEATVAWVIQQDNPGTAKS